MNLSISPTRRLWHNHRTVALTLALVLTLLSGCSRGRAAEQSVDLTLADKIDTVLHRLDDTGAIVSARFLEVPSGREIYATDNADYPFKPASNMKLLISSTGLDHFGAGHTFKTYLAIDGDDLWIIGTGDPGTGDPRIATAQGGTPTTILDDWAKALKARGITEIKGDLVYDDRILDDVYVHATWHPANLLHWYAAPVSGLAFNDNCVDITVTPGEEGNPANYTVMPPVENITVINNTISGGDEHAPAIVKHVGGNIYEITGPVTKEAELKSKPVESPGAFFADALKTNLKYHGIQVHGTIRRADTHLDGQLVPSEDKTVAIHESRIEDILARINKPSQNLFAEMLCKTTGKDYQSQHKTDEPGSWLNGKLAIKAFLKKANINSHPLVVADGSGLSHNNRVTTQMISSLLLYMHDHPDADVFFNSLTIGGVDGTIKSRFTEVPGRVRGKTGYISGVRALSGYIETDAGPTVIFSILYNEFSGSAKPYEKLQDEAVMLVMREYQPRKEK
jgi:D-alanyl-D-alanine carboxypeptidase/D-alanyl-D-alanine-endopeptidase (penicillin-binding protein 4)